MEIKEQLLLLQNQLLENDPEKMRSLEKENAKLKQQQEELVVLFLLCYNLLFVNDYHFEHVMKSVEAI